MYLQLDIPIILNVKAGGTILGFMNVLSIGILLLKGKDGRSVESIQRIGFFVIFLLMILYIFISNCICIVVITK